MNEISELMLKYWWVAPMVVCFMIILAWINVGMKISGW